MLTRRRIRRLHAEAERWWRNGMYWEGGSPVAAPGSRHMRIAFDGGRDAARNKSYHDMPTYTWSQVLAAWLADWT